MKTETLEAPEQVDATMNYLADPGDRLVSYMYKTPEGTPQRSWHVSKHPMTTVSAYCAVIQPRL